MSLPISGTVDGGDADVRRPGVVLAMEGWTTPRLVYAYSSGSKSFADTGLQPKSPHEICRESQNRRRCWRRARMQDDGSAFDSLSQRHGDDYDVERIRRCLRRMASMGTRFGAVLRCDPAGPWLQRGGVAAFAHVRGGGERGEAWHVAGMKTTKQHTIDDFVGSAGYLIEHEVHVGVAPWD